MISLPNLERLGLRVVLLAALAGGIWLHGYRVGSRSAQERTNKAEIRRLEAELQGSQAAAEALIRATRAAGEAAGAAQARAQSDAVTARRWRRAYENSQQVAACAAWAAAPVPCRVSGSPDGDSG